MSAKKKRPSKPLKEKRAIEADLREAQAKIRQLEIDNATLRSQLEAKSRTLAEYQIDALRRVSAIAKGGSE